MASADVADADTPGADVAPMETVAPQGIASQQPAEALQGAVATLAYGPP